MKFGNHRIPLHLNDDGAVLVLRDKQFSNWHLMLRNWDAMSTFSRRNAVFDYITVN